jgi:ribosomal protein S18 acetylase RimI-like enzyme
MDKILIRDAVATDAQALAALCIVAGHGVMTLLYDRLVPGKSLVDTIVERRVLNTENFAALCHWRVAVDTSGNMLGALNSFPHQVLMTAPADPLMDAARLQPIAALSELEATATDSYYVNIIAVFPKYRGCGAGFRLIQEAERLARSHNLSRVSLCTFANDEALVGFYNKQGFEVWATRAMEAHPAFETHGNWALMIRTLSTI